MSWMVWWRKTQQTIFSIYLRNCWSRLWANVEYMKYLLYSSISRMIWIILWTCAVTLCLSVQPCQECLSWRLKTSHRRPSLWSGLRLPFSMRATTSPSAARYTHTHTHIHTHTHTRTLILTECGHFVFFLLPLNWWSHAASQLSSRCNIFRCNTLECSNMYTQNTQNRHYLNRKGEKWNCKDVIHSHTELKGASWCWLMQRTRKAAPGDNMQKKKKRQNTHTHTHTHNPDSRCLLIVVTGRLVCSHGVFTVPAFRTLRGQSLHAERIESKNCSWNSPELLGGV